MPGQRPQRISRAQALALLTSIAEEDSGESDASDWEEDQHHANDWELSTTDEELSSENENEDVPDPSQSNASLSAASNNGQSSASLIPTVETVVEETAKDGTKWSFISLGSESRGRRAARNVLTEEAGLFRRSRQLSDSLLGAFLLLVDSHMISLVQNCTNVEARRVLSNKDWNVSRSELLAFIALLYVR